MLHEGKLFGLANPLLMLGVCLLILLGSLSGLLIWGRPRPQGRFGVPPLRHDLPRWKGGVALMRLLGVLFPLGATFTCSRRVRCAHIGPTLGPGALGAPYGVEVAA